MELLITKIRENKNNFNIMSNSEQEKLARLIEKEGTYPPLIVNKEKDGTYLLLDGHQRLAVLKKLKYKMVKVDIWELKEKDKLIALGTLNLLKGHSISEKRKEVYERIKRYNIKDIEDIRNIMRIKRKPKPRVALGIKYQFIQMLTKKEYKIVMDYFNNNFNDKERERGVFILVNERINRV